jgi:hypothetical protein
MGENLLSTCRPPGPMEGLLNIFPVACVLTLRLRGHKHLDSFPRWTTTHIWQSEERLSMFEWFISYIRCVHTLVTNTYYHILIVYIYISIPYASSWYLFNSVHIYTAHHHLSALSTYETTHDNKRLLEALAILHSKFWQLTVACLQASVILINNIFPW